MNAARIYGFALVLGISSVTVAASPYQTQDDHSGEIPAEVKCSQDMLFRWTEIDVDRNGQLDRTEIIASAVKANPMRIKTESQNNEGPF